MSYAEITLRRLASRCLAPGAWTAVVAALLLGAPAQATTYYVSPTGNDTNAGTSLGTAWTTIAKANQVLRAGDNVLIQPGSYSDGIVPTASGTSASRITYTGAIVGRALVSVASVDLTGRSYVTAKGVTSRGAINVSGDGAGNAARYDSVSYVTGLAHANIVGAYSCVFDHDSIGTGGTSHKLVVGTIGGSRTKYTKLVDCYFNLATISGGAALLLGEVLNTDFVRCKFDLTVAAGSTGAPHANMNYGIWNNTWTDCKFTFKNLGSYEIYGLNLRDSCRFNSWVRDTFTVHPASTNTVKYEFATTGAKNDWKTAGDGLGSCAYNTWADCYFKSDGLLGHSAGTHGYKFFGNTFITKSSFNPVHADSLIFRHNTILSTVNSAFWTLGDELTNATVRSNLFYATGANSYGTVEIADVASVTSDSNLVFASGQTESKAFGVRHTGSTCGPGPGCALCDAYLNECHSKWGDPQFTRVSWADADPTPGPGSIAALIGLWPDGYVGAINPGGTVGDLTPPDSISNLALALISDHTIVLRWTATGDDGTTGQASAYDLRWSNQPITAENFAAATPVEIQPVPAVAGTPQSYVLTDLTFSTNYYFALRVMDESGNWSKVGNVLAATTKATDTVPPAATTLGP
jgi:hypothetical protein